MNRYYQDSCLSLRIKLGANWPLGGAQTLIGLNAKELLISLILIEHTGCRSSASIQFDFQRYIFFN